MLQLETGTPASCGVMHASKWLRFRLLIDASDLKQWLEDVGEVSLINMCPVSSKEQLFVSPDALLKNYEAYIHQIKSGESVDEAFFQKQFSLHVTKDLNTCYQIELKEGTLFYAKERAPGIRVRLHNFSFDRTNSTTHSNVYTKNGISWGLEFSYPQIFATSIDDEVVYVLKSDQMPNNPLFNKLKKWVRRCSRPTRFVYDGQAFVSTIRLANSAKSWIDLHQGLRTNQLEVSV